MTQTHWKRFAAVVLIVLGIALPTATVHAGGDPVKIGITPFQDTVLPVVIETQGWFSEEGLSVEFVDLDWTEVTTALAAGEVDFALYTFDSMLPASPRLEAAGNPLVFYAPLYVFRGAAIMVHGDAGFETVGSIAGLSQEELRGRVASVVQQLRGKRVGITEGTTAERVVLDALSTAGMTTSDVTLIHARYADNMAAFLARDLDAFVGGVTERLRAEQAGAVELVTGDAVSVPVVDGWVTTEKYAKANRRTLNTATRLFFRVVRLMERDVEANATKATSYLEGRASISYTPEQYAVAWSFQEFASDYDSARAMFLDADSPYYWKRVWDANNAFLVKTGKINRPVSYSSFWGEDALRVSEQTEQGVAGATNAGPSRPPDGQQTPQGFVYHYQTLISALLAMLIGFVTLYFLYRQLNQHRELQRSTAVALCNMFHQELMLFARFFTSMHTVIRPALDGKKLGVVSAMKYPSRVAYDSQLSRLSELDPEVAFALMYFYQALLYLQKLTEPGGVGSIPQDVRAVATAYDRAVANLVAALGSTMNYRAKNGQSLQADEAVLAELRELLPAEAQQPTPRAATGLNSAS